jgi:hypothetical protein
MPRSVAWTGRELSLRQLLADPMVRAVMACDGVTRKEVETLFDTIRRSRSQARPLPRRAYVPESVITAGK